MSPRSRSASGTWRSTVTASVASNASSLKRRRLPSPSSKRTREPSPFWRASRRASRTKTRLGSTPSTPPPSPPPEPDLGRRPAAVLQALDHLEGVGRAIGGGVRIRVQSHRLPGKARGALPAAEVVGRAPRLAAHGPGAEDVGLADRVLHELVLNRPRPSGGWRQEAPHDRPQKEDEKKKRPQKEEPAHGRSGGIGADGQRAGELPVLRGELDLFAPGSLGIRGGAGEEDRRVGAPLEDLLDGLPGGLGRGQRALDRLEQLLHQPVNVLVPRHPVSTIPAGPHPVKSSGILGGGTQEDRCHEPRIVDVRPLHPDSLAREADAQGGCLAPPDRARGNLSGAGGGGDRRRGSVRGPRAHRAGAAVPPPDAGRLVGAAGRRGAGGRIARGGGPARAQGGGRLSGRPPYLPLPVLPLQRLPRRDRVLLHRRAARGGRAPVRRR